MQSTVEKPVGAGECFPVGKLQVKSLQETFVHQPKIISSFKEIEP